MLGRVLNLYYCFTAILQICGCFHFACVQVILKKSGTPEVQSPGISFELQPVVVEGNMDVPQQSLPQVKTQAQECTTFDITLGKLCVWVTYHYSHSVSLEWPFCQYFHSRSNFVLCVYTARLCS